MIITKERTRLIFTEFNESEKKYLEDLVASMDNVFMYIDPDGEKLGLPTGMEETVKKTFPKAKFIDKSKEYWPYATITPVEHDAKPRNQLQIDFINFIIENSKKKQKLAGIGSPGTGKLEPYSRKIPTPTGWKYMGDLQVGDVIFGSDGKRNIVTAIYEHGEQDIYKITFSDGRIALCGKDHLWTVFKSWTSSRVTLTTEYMMETYKQYDKFKDNTGRDPYKYIYKVPLLSAPVEYEHRNVPIDPYVVGAFIGNGCNTLPALSLSSGDEFVPIKVASRLGVQTRRESSSYTYTFFTMNDGKKNRLKTKEFFKELPELICYSRDKEIPEIYMYNDLNTRMELLRGLMDTDGSIGYAEGRFNINYSSCSRKLLEQIQYLIRGLGFIATIGAQDKRVDKYIDGFRSQVNIRVPQKFKQELFTHPRKLSIAKEAALRSDYQQPFTHLLIKDIRKIGREPSRCIRVSAEDELYLTEDFIVTHNTFMVCYSAIALQLRTMIIVPTSSIKEQWADTLTGMFKVPKERVKVIRKPSDFINVKADFVVVSQASLAVLNKKYDLEKIIKDNKFGIKAIDECQMWFKNIINVDANCNIANNWYLTGTFGRSGDTENALYQEMFGDLAIFREKDKKPTIFNRKPGNIYGMKPHMHCNMMWGHSRLSDEQIKSCTNSMQYSEREGKWMRMGINIPVYTELIIPSDGTMTKFLKDILNVIKTAETSVKYGRTLILCSTIASSNVIADYCRKMFPNKTIGTINSTNSKDTNDEVKAKYDIVISTVSSAGTGFDMKDLSKLVVIAQFKSWILADQVSGRLRRRPDGKDTYMWDIVDASIRQLKSWAMSRSDVLKRKSKTFKVIDM